MAVAGAASGPAAFTIELGKPAVGGGAAGDVWMARKLLWRSSSGDRNSGLAAIIQWRRTAAQSGAECPTAQAEGAEVGSLGVVTLGMQKPAWELTSTASFARVVVLLVLLCVLF